MKNDNSDKKINIRKKGTVIVARPDKTAVVAVNSFKTHPKYGKKYTMTKRYKVHDEEGKVKAGDFVEIVSIRPISKDKKYKIA